MSTLLMQRHEFRTAGVRESNATYYNIDNIEGVDILDHLTETLTNGAVFRHDPRRYSHVIKAQPLVRGMFFRGASGSLGQEGAVMNPDTAEPEFVYGPEHATTVNGRGLLLAPPDSKTLYACLERLPGIVPTLNCINGAKREWANRGLSVTWKDTWIQSGDEFLAEAQLKGFEVRRRSLNRPTSLSSVEHLGVQAWSATAARKHFFGKSLKEKLLSDPTAAHDLFEIEREDEDVTVLHLKGQGTSKTYIVERGNFPKVQPVLAEGLSDEGFIEACIEQLCQRVPLNWNAEWSKKR